MYSGMDMDALFESVYKKLSKPDFGKGLGGELPLFIQPVPPEKQLELAGQVDRLVARLKKKNIEAYAINLYDLCMEILEEEGILETILNEEGTFPEDAVISALEGELDIRTVLIPRIKELITEQAPDFVFIHGVGNVYPFIRSHSILNNIDELAKGCNLVLFFPGEYNRLQLNLFGLIADENYYRGHNLDEINEE